MLLVLRVAAEEIEWHRDFDISAEAIDWHRGFDISAEAIDWHRGFDIFAVTHTLPPRGGGKSA